MLTVEILQKKIEEEKQRWEQLSKEMEQQYIAQQGAYMGRIDLLQKMLDELQNKGTANGKDDKNE